MCFEIIFLKFQALVVFLTHLCDKQTLPYDNCVISADLLIVSLSIGTPCASLNKIGKKSGPSCSKRHYLNELGPVVQSVVSLTSSLRVISLTVLADSIHNILIFFAEKM